VEKNVRSALMRDVHVREDEKDCLTGKRQSRVQSPKGQDGTTGGDRRQQRVG